MKIKITKNFKDRLIGLMGKKNINYSLLIKNCKSIHTFFMKEEIDVLLLDKNNIIIDIKRNIKPNKIIIFKNKKRTNILEMPNNSSLKYKINDLIKLDE